MICWIHGFLGRAADWGPFLDLFPESENRVLDLFSGELAPSSISAWGERFSRSVPPEEKQNVVIGYSLGGRLALHALLAGGSVFDAAVIVSAGLGIEEARLRDARARSDEAWADRFLDEPWEPLMEAWNSQEVFGGGGMPEIREESRYLRSSLATALRSWSPAQHQPLIRRLPEISVPVLWIAGERDRRYTEEAERAVAALPVATLAIAPSSGHRVPWENPSFFRNAVREFLTPILRT